MTNAQSEQGPLRIVFFGLPEAGKSSLLGALVQVAQHQEPQLGGRVNDLAHGLGQLHKGVYERGPAPTNEEIVEYPVMIEPLPDNPRMPAGAATLIDSDGRVAMQLLAEEPAADNSALAKAMFDADTIILVVDASGDASQLGKTFTQFAHFLRVFEEDRSRASEVTDLPVYLVLSKCDLLAKKTDSPATWIQRIEERKRQVHQRFQQFIEGALAAAPAPMLAEDAFGKVDLHVWATAVGRPALGDRPANPIEPFGVAELFRQCLESAAEFRQRSRRAYRRLRFAVFGAGALVTLMLVLAVVFFATRPDPVVTALENESRFVLPAPAAKPAERLKEPLTEKLKKLRKIQENPKFDRMPAEVQGQVVGYLAELDAYQAYDKQFLQRVQPEPQDASRDKDLNDIEKAINAVPLPSPYAAAWKDTKVGRRIQQWLSDVKLVREAVAKTEKWFIEQHKQAEKLRKEGAALLLGTPTPKEREDWLERAREFAEQQQPHEPTDRIAGTSGLTYATVYNFDQVIKARNDLGEFKQRRLDQVIKLIRD